MTPPEAAEGWGLAGELDAAGDDGSVEVDAVTCSECPAEAPADGPQPATLRTARAMVPRLAWIRNERRVRSIVCSIVGRWYDGVAKVGSQSPVAPISARPYDARPCAATYGVR